MVVKCSDFLVRGFPIFEKQRRIRENGIITLRVLLALSSITYKICFAIVNGDKVPSGLYTFALRSCAMYLANENATESDISQCLVPIARIFFQICGVSIIILLFMKYALNKSTNMLNKLLSVIKFVLLLQTSSANIPLFLIFEILTSVTPDITPIFSLCLQNLTFFQFGGTNSIATVNLTNAYNGVSSNYNIYVVGVLMFLSNYAPSIYWALSLIPQSYKQKTLRLQHYYITGTCLMIACIALRYHLFIWSVFSPKLCYYAAWSLYNVVMDFAITLLGVL